MSVRAVESRFNLRTVVADETAARPLVLTQAPVTALFSQPAPSPAPSKPGLKFDFSKIRGATQSAQPKAAPKLDLKPAQFAAPLKNPFEPSNNKADVMRLTAVVDDLTGRLKKATDRAVMAEGQLQKTHSALVTERNNASDRIKAANAQLGAAHATESQLRAELAKSVKTTPPAPAQAKTKSFDSAVSAVMAAEGAAEKTKKEMDALKSKLLAQDVEAKQMNQEIHELRADAAEANTKAMDLHRKFSDAAKEVAEARKAEREALADRDRVAEELENAKALLAQAIEAQAKEAAAHAETEAVEVGVAKEDAEADNAFPPQMAMSCCPKCGSDMSESADVAAESIDVSSLSGDKPVNEYAHIENAPSTEVPVPAAVAMDPIKTHARYSRLRERVMSLTASIARLQRNNQKDELLAGMIEKRDDLYKRAKELKAQYDTVFGAADPDSVVKLSGMERFADGKPDDVIDVREAEESYYAPIGDAPEPCMSYTISFAREMARNCPVSGAFDFGSLDCGVGVGKAMMKPITLNRVLIGDDVENGSEPTERHEAHNDMVTAVVSDLTKYLKYVKSLGEAEYMNSEKEAMTRSYA